MNNPYYCLLKNRYIAPTINAGAPSPRTENSGTVDVVVFVVGVAVTTCIVGVAVAFTVAAAVGVFVGVAVGVFVGVAVGVCATVAAAVGVAAAFTGAAAVGVAAACCTVVVPIAAFIADSICACVTDPSNLADCAPETTIVGVSETPFADAIPFPGLVVTSYVTNVTPYFAAAL